MEEAAGGKLRKVDWVTAVLLASGVAESDLARQRNRLTAALAPAVQQARRKKDLRDRGQTLLQALHDTVLRRYEATATHIPRVLEAGEYNCVSSVVLFMAAAQGLLPEPRAVITPSHAFGRVSIDGKSVDVEATSPQGFGADRARLLTPEFARRIGISRTVDGKTPNLAAEYAQAMELPPVALLAAIYSNRAVDMLQQSDLRGAATALDRATRLAQGAQKARVAEWRATLLSNVASDLVEKGRYSEAIPLLQLGLQDLGPARSHTLKHNLALCYVRQAEQFMKAGEPGEAMRWLDQAATLGTWDWLGEKRQQVISSLATRERRADRCEPERTVRGSPQARAAAECLAQVSQVLLNDKDVDGAVAAARRAAARDPSVSNARIAMWNALSARAMQRGEADRCDLAEHDYRELERYRDVARDDRSTWEINAGHCWGAMAYRASRAKKYAEAETWLKRALIYEPNDKVLRHNLATSLLTRAKNLGESSQCDEARPLVASARYYAPDMDSVGSAVLANCAYRRGAVPFNNKQWRQAAQEFRRGLKDVPDSKELRTNLAAALHNEAAQRISAGDCEEGLALAAEVAHYGMQEQAKALEAACR